MQIAEGMLRSRTVLITGAGQGLGQACAHNFAKAGANVVIAELNEARDVAVANKLKQYDGDALAVTTDVADSASIESMVSAVTEQFGRIDILINDAGLNAALNRRPFWEIPDDEWDAVMRINAGRSFAINAGLAHL